MKDKTEKLTAKQCLFAERLAQGDTQAEAYVAAFGSKGKSKASIDSAASRLARERKVVSYYDAVRQNSKTGAEMTRGEKLKLLREFALDEELTVPERLKAIDIDNKMQGHNEPEKVDMKHDVHADLMGAVLTLQAARKAPPKIL